jgi:hypothetical protein
LPRRSEGVVASADGSPKRFAQGIGAVLSTIALVAHFAFGATTLAMVLVAANTVAATLEWGRSQSPTKWAVAGALCRDLRSAAANSRRPPGTSREASQYASISNQATHDGLRTVVIRR